MNLLNTLAYLCSHPLTRDRPMAALARFARWQLQSRLQSEVRHAWVNDAVLIARRGMTGATGNIYCGLHEFPDMAFFAHLLRPGDLFIDAGANVGSYTVLAGKVAGADVIAVEPDPEALRHLQRNVEANAIGAQVEIAPYLLGATCGSATMTKGLDTMNRVAREGDSGPVQELPMRTLDELVAGRHPVAIKLDVEGFEPEVLAGAAQVLSDPALLAIETESRDQQVLRVLARYGFTRRFYDPDGRQLALTHCSRPHNGLFVREIDQCEQRLRSAAPLRILGKSI